MQHAQDASAYAFEGIWVNWSKGGTKGLTWTLCPTNATILISTLAVFVTMAGGQLWTILRFSLHQLRATPQSRTTTMLHKQQQVVLRNAATDLTTLRLFFCLLWSWRKNSRNSLSSSLPVMAVALASRCPLSPCRILLLYPSQCRSGRAQQESLVWASKRNL